MRRNPLAKKRKVPPSSSADETTHAFTPPREEEEDKPSSPAVVSKPAFTPPAEEEEDKPSSSANESVPSIDTPDKKEAKKYSGPLSIILRLGDTDSFADSQGRLAELVKQIKECKKKMEDLKKEMTTLKEQQIKEREKQMKDLGNVVINLLQKVKELEDNKKSHLARKAEGAHPLIEAAVVSTATASKEQLMSTKQLPERPSTRSKRKRSDDYQSHEKRQKKNAEDDE